MVISIGDNITLLKDSNIYKEMVCFNIKMELNQKYYYFQSIDEDGRMQIDRISESILNALDWKESSIPRFFCFDKISDILENYHNISQLDFKGFTTSYINIAGTKDIESVSLYFKNDNLYLEVICFGKVCSFPYYKHYFNKRGENIPYIYIRETNKLSELHLNSQNKLYYSFDEEIKSFEMNDISSWIGKDYLNKLEVPVNYVPNIKEEITLEGYGIEFKIKQKKNIGLSLASKTNLEGESIIIFGHKNEHCLDFFITGILVDGSFTHNPVNHLLFMRSIQN